MNIYLHRIALLTLVTLYMCATTIAENLQKTIPKLGQYTKEIEFTATIKKPSNSSLSLDLTPDLFEVIENGKSLRVNSIERVSKPLAVILVFTVGATGYGGVLEVDRMVNYICGALRNSLTLNDKLAIIQTDQDTTLFDFDEPEKILDRATNKLDAAYGDFEKRNKYYGFSNQNSNYYISPLAIELNSKGEWQQGIVSFHFSGANQNQNSPQIIPINLARQNYLAEALKKGISQYSPLLRKKYTPVMIICNTIYNLSEYSKMNQDLITNEVLKERISVSWIGSTQGSWSELAPKSRLAVSLQDTEIYQKLPDLTGGEKINSLLIGGGPINTTFPYQSHGNFSEFNRSVKDIIASQREQYRIIFLSPDSNTQKTKKFYLR